MTPCVFSRCLALLLAEIQRGLIPPISGELVESVFAMAGIERPDSPEAQCEEVDRALEDLAVADVNSCSSSRLAAVVVVLVSEARYGRFPVISGEQVAEIAQHLGVDVPASDLESLELGEQAIASLLG